MKTSQQVERSSEIVFMMVLKIALPLLLLPAFIASCGNYFLANMGNNSFQLPVPMW